MFFPARGNNTTEVRVNGEPFDVGEEAKHLLRGVFPDGAYSSDLCQAGNPGLPDAALQKPHRSLASRVHGLQTTYTTAGTIYDPTSRLLLQPPNRRGRSSKPGHAIPHSDLALSAAGMSILDPAGKLDGSGGGIRMTTAASLRNYTPLQQNYDRAINPFNDFDHQRPVSMPIQTSRKRPLDGPPSYYYDPESDEMVVARAISEEGDDKDKSGVNVDTKSGGRDRARDGSKSNKSGNDEGSSRDDNGDDGCDKENDWGMDPLMNMPVKSLHNLASYPNPNQKKAQKILLLGAKPNIMKSLKFHGSSPLAHANELPRGHDKPLSHDHPSGYDDYHRSPSFSVMEDFKDPQSGMALGPGAPKPLTAGPPGQRQYRPSNLGSVPRGLSPRHLLLPSYSFGSEDATSAAPNASIMLSGIDEAKVISASSSSSGRYFGDVQEYYSKLPTSDPSCPAEPSMQEARDSCSGGSWFSRAMDPCADPACRDEPLSSYSYTHTPAPGGLADGVTAESSSGQETFSHLPIQPGSWASFPPGPSCEWQDASRPPQQYDLGVGRLSAEQLAERNERIHSLWFQGTGLFGEPPSDATEARRSQCPRNRDSFGAVGDGRPSGKAKTDKTSIEL